MRLLRQACHQDGVLGQSILMEQIVEVKIPIPEEVNSILVKLQESGYEAYIVGGCVRDALLGREPNDWDITTSALPLEVKRIFVKTVDTGLQHGTVTVLAGGKGYEVTTYRVDGVYEDGRHPKEVTFTPSLREDLQRRDFTINAMAYREPGVLVDLFGGQKDLEDGVIRAVGDPSQRFSEDALRILRAGIPDRGRDPPRGVGTGAHTAEDQRGAHPRGTGEDDHVGPSGSSSYSVRGGDHSDLPAGI